MELSQETKKILLGFQRNELTEYHIYHRIAKRVRDEKDAATLRSIGDEELRHSEIWKGYTGTDVAPKRGKIVWLALLSSILGYTFALKLMEGGEDVANDTYEKISAEVPAAKKIAEEEDQHERALLDILDEERLQYVGSMVLGLNDALVELTGTLAGLTLALQNTKLIALSGLITGISATLSMASSEYLSAKAAGEHNAFKSATYTGIMYVIAVALMVLPYLLFPAERYLAALFTMLAIVVLVILVFNYYLAVAKDLDFKKRFFEMAGISLSVAALSFVIGLLAKRLLGIDL
ncbi:MAG: VIT1/CCC1 transporter family protein [Oscillospiraceae bacterium]|nr:VIT1/CCC1 transporter family protein [Oscillospiraceae bacterium]